MILSYAGLGSWFSSNTAGQFLRPGTGSLSSQVMSSAIVQKVTPVTSPLPSAYGSAYFLQISKIAP